MRNYLQLRRGPYVIAAVLDESVDDSPLRLSGSYLDLLDPELTVHEEVTVQPGQQAWLLDLQRVSDQNPLLLAAAGRVRVVGSGWPKSGIPDLDTRRNPRQYAHPARGRSDRSHGRWNTV